jgi:hypothetical protein
MEKSTIALEVSEIRDWLKSEYESFSFENGNWEYETVTTINNISGKLIHCSVYGDGLEDAADSIGELVEWMSAFLQYETMLYYEEKRKFIFGNSGLHKRKMNIARYLLGISKSVLTRLEKLL